MQFIDNKNADMDLIHCADQQYLIAENWIVTIVRPGHRVTSLRIHSISNILNRLWHLSMMKARQRNKLFISYLINWYTNVYVWTPGAIVTAYWPDDSDYLFNLPLKCCFVFVNNPFNPNTNFERISFRLYWSECDKTTLFTNCWRLFA